MIPILLVICELQFVVGESLRGNTNNYNTTFPPGLLGDMQASSPPSSNTVSSSSQSAFPVIAIAVIIAAAMATCMYLFFKCTLLKCCPHQDNNDDNDDEHVEPAAIATLPSNFNSNIPMLSSGMIKIERLHDEGGGEEERRRKEAEDERLSRIPVAELVSCPSYQTYIENPAHVS